jgi:hypothetical protein
MTGRWPTWVVAPALAAPLVALTAWLAHGILVPPTTQGRIAPPTVAATPALGTLLPDADLPADRLEERVDGAAEALRADGCRRLLHWRFETPPADAEALVFRTVDGAMTVLAREAGNERTPGPGDEAQLSAQSAYFRRGPVYVRIFLDPGAAAGSELRKRAEEIDRMLTSGGPL